MHLYDLPYDVRSQIYDHLFPKTQQIYIFIIQNTLRAIIPDDRIPTELLLTSPEFYTEASEYLYNGYIFNLLGTKKDCLANYKIFHQILQKHARDKVHVHAFSNGAHSSTMCISFQAGDSKLALLERRSRGQLRTIPQIELELALAENSYQRTRWLRSVSRSPLSLLCVMSCILIALLCLWLGPG